MVSEQKRAGVVVDVSARLDQASADEANAALRDALTDGIRSAVGAVTFGLTLTPDERDLIERYRSAKVIDRRRAHDAIRRCLFASAEAV